MMCVCVLREQFSILTPDKRCVDLTESQIPRYGRLVVSSFRSPAGSESEGHFALIDELLAGLVHLDAREVVDREAIDDLPLTTGGDAQREGVHDSSGGTVRVAVADDTHVAPLAFGGTEPEVVHVVASGSGSRGG